MNFEFWSNIPSIAQNLFLGSILIFTLSSISFFYQKKIFLPLLGFSALLIAMSFAKAVPWLYPWDEQFHALVGKNLAKNPFHPMLIDLDTSLFKHKTWADQRTWLHKQPLFLYQIALSIKLIGNTAFAVRLPSVLLHIAGTLTLFDMGRILLNKKVGFLAASLFLFSFYPLGMLSGRIGTDHNDSVFMIYVLLSFWAYFRFTQNRSNKWAYWVGAFVGLAVLTKWLVGLLVFAPWGIFALLALRKKNKSEILFLIRALMVSILIVLPWQIYIHSYFPEQANYEMAYNTRHFFEIIEGHDGDWKFHLENLSSTFFSPIILGSLLILSLGSTFIEKTVSKNYWTLWVATLAVFLFFTLSKTKMNSFVIPTYPFVLLLMSFGLVKTIDLLRHKILRPTIYCVVGCWLVFVVFKAENTITDIGFYEENSTFIDRGLYQEQLDFIRINGTKDSKTIIINADLRGRGNISWMFFSNNLALNYIPKEKMLRKMKQIGYKIKVIEWIQPLPEYVTKDTSIQRLKFQ